MINYIIILFFEIVISIFFIACTMNVLAQHGMLCRNYRQENILFPMGIAYIPIITASQLLYLAFFGNSGYLEFLLLSFCAAATAFTGLIDDLAGQKEIKGYKQHFVALVHGKLTTGIAKAFSGCIISILSCLFISKSLVELLINTAVVLFSTNTINLLDVRPGRAIKFFILSAVLLILFNLSSYRQLYLLLSVLIPTITLFFYDIKERGMLGDTGSNLLGFILGFYFASLINIYYKLLILLFLVLANMLSERMSLTKVIEGNKLLSYFDSLGRRKDEN